MRFIILNRIAVVLLGGVLLVEGVPSLANASSANSFAPEAVEIVSSATTIEIFEIYDSNKHNSRILAGDEKMYVAIDGYQMGWLYMSPGKTLSEKQSKVVKRLVCDTPPSIREPGDNFNCIPSWTHIFRISSPSGEVWAVAGEECGGIILGDGKERLLGRYSGEPVAAWALFVRYVLRGE